MPRLTAEQMQAIAATEWLLDSEHRAEGRTTAIAIGIIRLAAAYPGRAVFLRDHARSGDALRDIVEHFVHADPILRVACHQGRLASRTPSLVIELATPILDWMPAGWSGPRLPARVRETPPHLSLDPRRVAPVPSVEERLTALRDRRATQIAQFREARANSLGSAWASEQDAKPDAPTPGSLWDYLDADS